MSIQNTVNGVHEKPTILHLGEVVLAHDEWKTLAATTTVIVVNTGSQIRHILADYFLIKSGTREEFIRDCQDGALHGVVAISRTWDSTEVSSLVYIERGVNTTVC